MKDTYVPLEPQAGLWYFAHPYTVVDAWAIQNHAAMEANFRLCCLRAARLVEAGWLIYSPVAHTHPIKAAWPEFMAATTEQRWYEYDLLFIQAIPFAGIILPPLWHVSRGCIEEEKLFEQLGRSVRYFSDPCLVRAGTLFEHSPIRVPDGRGDLRTRRRVCLMRPEEVATA
ncbi:MAG: DUF1937 family protein [Planctomycetes bacterium]|nr:DUF1937 family protein [Planctomycetota bacterium]